MKQKNSKLKILILSLTIIGGLGGWLYLTTQANSSDRPEAWMKYRYSILADAQDPDAELRFYETRVAAQPKSALDWASLAAAYRDNGRRTGEHEWFHKAEHAAETSLGRLPYFNPGAKMLLARLAQDRHDFSAALKLAEEVLRENPGNAEALAVKVTSNLALGKVAEALPDAESLVSRFPGSAAFTMRALLRLEIGQDAQALEDFQRAILAEDVGDHEASAWVRSLLGRYHLRQDHPQTARFLLTEALRIRPDYPLAMGLLAEFEAKEGNILRAEPLYRRAYEILPEPSFRVDLGAALAAAGRREEAELLWQEAEAQMREDLKWHPYGHRGELVHLLLNRGRAVDIPEAVKLAEAEAEIRKDKETMETLAWAQRVAKSLSL